MAQLEDLPAVLGLVQQLAVYEKEPEAVTATIEEYEQQFNQGLYEVIVAEVEGTVVGMALYYMTFSTWKGLMLYLEDFYIEPTYRRRGIGLQMWNRLIELGHQKGAKLMKWQVLDWNTPAVRFYEKIGSTIEKEWWNGKIFFDK